MIHSKSVSVYYSSFYVKYNVDVHENKLMAIELNWFLLITTHVFKLQCKIKLPLFNQQNSLKLKNRACRNTSSHAKSTLRNIK